MCCGGVSGSDIRMKMGWKIMTKTEKSGAGSMWERWVLPLLTGAVDWVWKGSYRTALVPRVPARMRSCGAKLSGRILHSGVGHCLPVCGGAKAHLMKPWCAEGEVPTGGDSCVRWHCEDGLLFGWVGTSKLIVSVSFGSHASFKWKGKSCSDGEVSSCCIGHGDILVMDGQCQDEFLHCTDSGREQERINVTFRWIKQHSFSCPLRTGIVCCLPTCAQGSSAAVTGEVRGWRILGILGAPWRPVFTSCLQDSGYGGVPVAGHALWAEVGGGILCVTLGEFIGLHNNVHLMIMEVCASLCETAQSPWLLCMKVSWVKGAFWRNCRQILCKTSLSRFRVFLCSQNFSFWRSGVPIWHLWIGRARHPGPDAASFAVEVFYVGGWFTHGDLVLDTKFDFPSAVEHRLIPARVRSEWARLRRKGLATV